MSVASIKHLKYSQLDSKEKVKLAFENKKEIKDFLSDTTSHSDFKVISFSIEDGNEMGSHTITGSVVGGVGAVGLGLAGVATGGIAFAVFGVAALVVGPVGGVISGARTMKFTQVTMYFSTQDAYIASTYAEATKALNVAAEAAAEEKKTKDKVLISFDEVEESHDKNLNGENDGSHQQHDRILQI